MLFTDNASQFISAEFNQFSKRWNFDHDTSAPHHPKSNGMAERMIQTVKRTLKKAFRRNEDLYLALLTLNSTPDDKGFSPAFKLMGRKVRTNLPSAKMNDANISAQQKPVGVDIANRKPVEGGKDLNPIKPGCTVRIRTDKQSDWMDKGVVVQKCPEPRSYLVKNQKGNVVRRNRKHLLPTKEKYEVQINYDDLDYAMGTYPEINPNPKPKTDILPIEELTTEESSHTVAPATEEKQTRSGRSHEVVPVVAPATEEKQTRSGRSVRKPRYLKDYE